MKLSPEKINDIAQELDMGMTCYVHKKSHEVVSLPDENDSYFEPEMWQEQLDKIDKQPSDYVIIETMSSRDSFQIMEDFADQIPDLEFRGRLLRKLARKSPFSNFKNTVSNSAYLDDWYEFKQKAMEAWVEKQLTFLS